MQLYVLHSLIVAIMCAKVVMPLGISTIFKCAKVEVPSDAVACHGGCDGSVVKSGCPILVSIIGGPEQQLSTLKVNLNFFVAKASVFPALGPKIILWLFSLVLLATMSMPKLAEMPYSPVLPRRNAELDDYMTVSPDLRSWICSDGQDDPNCNDGTFAVGNIKFESTIGPEVITGSSIYSHCVLDVPARSSPLQTGHGLHNNCPFPEPYSMPTITMPSASSLDPIPTNDLSTISQWRSSVIMSTMPLSSSNYCVAVASPENQCSLCRAIRTVSYLKVLNS
uniref:NPC1_N domain-containing protein n=1 Tax=Panagrellus redivivus TaxID=6233 RepID=A0A7E4VTQ4_PANRE